MNLKKEEKQDIVMEKPELKSSENDPQPEISNSTSDTIVRDEPKLGRNEIVKITNGTDTKEIKYKKAKPLIESGDWRML